jgi:hypothetical protein
MDPIENPYTPNAGSRPPELAGRDEQLEIFRVAIGKHKRGSTEQSLIAKGLRGVGKTVLLNACENYAESEGFLTFFHELTPELSLVNEIARDAEKALTRLSLGEKITARVRGALGHMRTIRLTGPEGFGLAVDLAQADEGTLTSDLTDLFLELGTAARDKGSGVVFLLDEVQFADEAHYRALISALHRCTQKELPILMAAAGLPQIPRLTGEARSYAERLFNFQDIGSLAEPEATAALIAPAERQSIEFEAGAVAAALEWTAGYPFFLQQLGKHAWNRAAGPNITEDDIRSAIPAAQAALDGSIYEVRYQRASPAERQYLRAMAELGPGPYPAGDVSAKLGRTSSAVSVRRDSLIKKGLVYATEDWGHVAFTVPRFDEYMRRVMTYTPPDG